MDNNDIYSELLNVSDKQNYTIDVVKRNADALETIKDMVSVQPEPPVVVVPDTVVIQNLPEVQKVEVLNPTEQVDLTSVEELLAQLVELVPSLKDERNVEAVDKLTKLLAEDQSRDKVVELLRAILDKEDKPFEIPAELLSKEGRIKVEVDRAGGGGGGSSMMNTDGTKINPATSEKQNEIISAIQAIPGGGGTQYTEGDTDASITGTALLFEGAGNTLTVPSSTNPLPVLASISTAGLATDTNQTTIIGHLDGVETLLTSIEANQLPDGHNVTIDNVSIPVTGTFYQAIQPVSGTITASAQPGVDIGDVTINNGVGVAAVNIQDGGNSITVDGTVGVSGSVAVTGTFWQATQPVSGTVSANATLTAETTKVIGTVNVSTGQTITEVPATSGGLSKFHLVGAATTNATNIKASAGQVYAITAFNIAATPVYLKFHNTAGTPTAGTGVTDTFLIPGNTSGAGALINIDKGITFSTGIGISLVTGIADASAVAITADSVVVNIYYK